MQYLEPEPFPLTVIMLKTEHKMGNRNMRKRKLLSKSSGVDRIGILMAEYLIIFIRLTPDLFLHWLVGIGWRGSRRTQH